MEAIHLKTGNTYLVIGKILSRNSHTNIWEEHILYSRNNQTYSRIIDQFNEKFVYLDQFDSKIENIIKSKLGRIKKNSK